MHDAVLRASVQHEHETTLMPGVTAELIAHPFKRAFHELRRNLTVQADRKIDDRLGSQAGNRGRADVLDARNAPAELVSDGAGNAFPELYPFRTRGGQPNGSVVESQPEPIGWDPSTLGRIALFHRRIIALVAAGRASLAGAEDARISLIELAIAFVLNHPAVTSAIVGPWTIEQLDSQLPAAEVALDAGVLDRIDEIVRPGVTLNPADTGYGEQVLQPGLRRRLEAGELG